MRYGRRHDRHRRHDRAGFTRTQTDPIGRDGGGRGDFRGERLEVLPWTEVLLADVAEGALLAPEEPPFQELELPLVDLTGVIVSVSGSALATCHHGTVRFDGTSSRSIMFLIMIFLEQR